MKTCSVDDCDRPTRTRGLCNMHYQRQWAYGTTDKPRGQRQTVEDLIEARGWTVSENGCWEWGGMIRPDGYGELCAGQRRWLAHRAVYTHHVGPIPAGLVLRHRCDNPPCVNPEHLEPGTQRDNIRDMVKRGRHQWVGRTECAKGHDLTAPGAIRVVTASTGAPTRQCVECRRARERRAQARYRAKRHAQTTTTEAHYIHGDHAIHLRVLDAMAHELIEGGTA